MNTVSKMLLNVLFKTVRCHNLSGIEKTVSTVLLKILMINIYAF